MNGDEGSVGKTDSRKALSIPAIKKHLTTKHVGRELHFAESLLSTNKTLIEKAQEGACHGTVVLAETQTGGRGRQRRLWYSPAGVNLYFSVLLRPAFSPDKAPPITLASAVATAEAVEIVTGVKPTLKWPNDLLLGKKKLSGILTEMSADTRKIRWIVLGVGLNVNTKEFPSELETIAQETIAQETITQETITQKSTALKSIATSLRLYTGRCHPRELLLATILERLEHWFTVLTEEGAAVVIDAWKAKPNILGQLVTVKTAGKPNSLSGLAKDLDDDGALLLETREGAVERIISGDLVQNSP